MVLSVMFLRIKLCYNYIIQGDFILLNLKKIPKM